MNGIPDGIAVQTSADVLRHFTRAGAAMPLAAAQPRDTAQIQSLIKWANQRGQKLVPVSSARGPRVHGGSVPEAPAVVVDLSRMKRIRHIDALDAIAVIEPGVTFPEFDTQLAAHGLRSYKPLLPRRSKSVIASHLEREPITSPRDQWDAADPLSAVELVFGTGEKFRTGTAAIADELEEQLEHGLRQMSSIGPFATDFTRVVMGSQGTLGIVSWASIYCERIPALEQAFFVSCHELEPLVKLSSKIGWRKLAAQCFIVNRLQLAMMLAEDRAGIARLAERLPAWVLFANLSATDYFPEERLAFEVEALAEDAAALGLEVCESLAEIEAGRITRMQQNLPEVWYKDRFGAAHDEIFFLSQSDRAPGLVSAFEAQLAASGSRQPYAAYIQPRVQSSSCHVEFTSYWDGDEATRVRFHADASAALGQAGAYFSRPYGDWKRIAYERDPGIVPHLRRTKAMFDPNAVLNPGKSC